jgi:tRNA(Ile2) C34 agmatinyltransferase TiaS
MTRCGACEGKPPGDGEGNYHRCWRCGGASERLRLGAWVTLKVGIPVPRARKPAKRNRMGL